MQCDFLYKTITLKVNIFNFRISLVGVAYGWQVEAALI